LRGLAGNDSLIQRGQRGWMVATRSSLLWALDAKKTSPDGVKLPVAVVVPCFRTRRHIEQVVGSILGRVGHIYVVDDGCPEESGPWWQNCSMRLR